MDWFPSYNIYIYIYLYLYVYIQTLASSDYIMGIELMGIYGCSFFVGIYGESMALFYLASVQIELIYIYIYSSNGLCCFRCFVLWYLFGNVWKIRRYNMTQLTGWMIIYGIQWDTLGYGIWLHDAKEHEGFDLCRMMLMVWFCFLFGVVDG